MSSVYYWGRILTKLQEGSCSQNKSSRRKFQPACLPELLRRRPDILQAEQELAAATARIGVAKADRFPQVTLTGILGVASPRLSNLFKSDTEFGAAGFDLVGPLFNSEALGFQQDVAEAQAKQVFAQYEQTVLVALREVEDALIAVQTARSQRQAQAEQVAALRSALRLANLRYQGGVTSYIDVLIAKRSLFDAELSLADTHRLHLVSIVQLYKALGGGWSPDYSGKQETGAYTTDAAIQLILLHKKLFR